MVWILSREEVTGQNLFIGLTSVSALYASASIFLGPGSRNSRSLEGDESARQRLVSQSPSHSLRNEPGARKPATPLRSAAVRPAPSTNKANPSLPGRAPKRPDSDLNPAELERRNKRRARNREAAERQRQRRQHKVVQLEEEVTALKTEKNELKEQNKKLQEEIERVRFQLKVLEGSQRQMQQHQYHHHQQPMTTMASSLTPTLISNHSGQIFMTDAATPVTPVFVSTPVFAAATLALTLDCL